MNYTPPTTQFARRTEAEAIALSDILALLRRNLTLILGAIALFLVLGAAAVILMPKKYEASALVLIDPRRMDILADKAQTDARLLTTDSLVVDSEVQILNSRELLKRVAERARIYDDPEYTSPSPVKQVIGSLLSFLYAPFGSDETAEVDPRSRILAAFGRNISVQRVNLTYVLEITYESESATRAAEVVNIITDEYLSDGLRVQSESSRKSAEWLRQRLADLQKDVIAADRAVEVYKMEYDLVSTQSGGLVAEQQLAEISTRLVGAKADVAQARARFDAATELLASGNFATLSGNGGSDVLSKLLTDRQTEQQEAARILSVYGQTHLAYQKIASRITEIDRLIREELQRIAHGYEADLKAATQLAGQLESSLAAIKQAALQGGEREVKLRDLEQRATAAKSIYQSMLDALERSMQQQSLPTTTARVIQSADPPPKWTKPNWMLFGALSLVLGVGSGVGGAFLREGLKSSVHGARDVELVTGRPHLGSVPRLAELGGRPGRLRETLNTIKAWSAQPLLGLDGRAIEADALAGYHAVLRSETGPALEALRAMEVAVRLNQVQRAKRGAVVIAVGSALPGEGKSTLSALFAMHLATGGAKVLLVDYDFRRSGLTRQFQPSLIAAAPVTSSEPPTDESRAAIDAMMYDPLTGLIFLPAPGRKDVAKEISRVISDGTERRIAALRSCFDFIILDLPPLFHLPQGRVLAHEVDKFVFVVEWGKADSRVLERSLACVPELAAQMVGTILNKSRQREAYAYDRYAA